MDRISDSGSDGCGSIPHGGTSKGGHLTDAPLCLYPVHPQSLRDSPGGACRPFASLWPGAVAGLMFCKHLPDAIGTALKRLSGHLQMPPFACTRSTPSHFVTAPVGHAGHSLSGKSLSGATPVAQRLYLHH